MRRKCGICCICIIYHYLGSFFFLLCSDSICSPNSNGRRPWGSTSYCSCTSTSGTAVPGVQSSATTSMTLVVKGTNPTDSWVAFLGALPENPRSLGSKRPSLHRPGSSNCAEDSGRQDTMIGICGHYYQLRQPRTQLRR